MTPNHVQFNINDYVSVRLTEAGKKLHRQQYEQLSADYPKLQSYQEPKTDAMGYSQWQFWYLMQTFGPYISMGSESPIETVAYLHLPTHTD